MDFLKELKKTKTRRSLHKRKNETFCTFRLCFCIFGIIVGFFFAYFTSCFFYTNDEISNADNQTLNWMHADNIYNFKLKKLDGNFVYLSELKNRVLLIVK